jgi:hypothetical protein
MPKAKLHLPATYNLPCLTHSYPTDFNLEDGGSKFLHMLVSTDKATQHYLHATLLLLLSMYICFYYCQPANVLLKWQCLPCGYNMCRLLFCNILPWNLVHTCECAKSSLLPWRWSQEFCYNTGTYPLQYMAPPPTRLIFIFTATKNLRIQCL